MLEIIKLALHGIIRYNKLHTEGSVEMRKNAVYTVTLIVILALLCLMTLAGCADTGEENPAPAGESAAPQDEAPADGPATVRFAGFSAGEQYAQTFQNMLSLFSEAHPQITVIDESAGYGDYFTELAADVGSGRAPDVFELDAAHIADFTASELIQPMEPALINSDLGIYRKGLIRLCIIDTQLMALPFSFHTVMLVYNMDLFDAAGIDYPASEWVWDDVLVAAQEIAKPEEDVWGCYYPIDSFDEFYTRVMQNRGRMLTSDGTAFTINAPQNVEALQWLQDLVWVYRVMPTTAEQMGRSEYDLFAAGKLGMFTTDTRTFSDLRDRCADIRWGVAPEPGNTRQAARVSCSALCVNNDAAEPSAAYTLARFLTGDPDVQRLRLDAGWDLPAVSNPSVMKAYVNDTPPANKAAVMEAADRSVRPFVMEDIGILADQILPPHLQAVRDNEEIPLKALNAAQMEAERRISLPKQ